MLLGTGTIQMTGEILSPPEVQDICDSLEKHGIRFLSLRDCKVGDKEFKKLMKAVGVCKSILQLNLNLGLVNDRFRVELVAQALVRNRSLQILFMHGNKLRDEGVQVICQALAQHPQIISLDLGDSGFGDDGIEAICDLLPPNGAKPGLQDLTLSANAGVTARGWAKLAMAIGASSMLKSLYVDYNTLGDYGAGCFAVALAANRRIEVLDLEGTGLTEHTAKLFLHLVQNYPVRLKRLVLSENKVHRSTVEAIKTSLGDYEDQDSEVTSELGDTTPGQKIRQTEVKIRPVIISKSETEGADQPGKSQALQELSDMMNTVDVLDTENNSSGSVQTPDNDTTHVKSTVVHGTPKIQQSKRSQATPSTSTSEKVGSLNETEDWGEELKEVPLHPQNPSQSSWISFKKQA